jgi:hypothetical protein
MYWYGNVCCVEQQQRMQAAAKAVPTLVAAVAPVAADMCDLFVVCC